MEINSRKDMVQLNGATGSRQRFLGLKWKVLLLSSLILIAIVGSFTGITYRSLMNDFESQRDVQHQRYALEVEGLIDQISENLHQLAHLIPFLEGMNTALLASSGKNIARTFDPYWAPLQLDKDIELIRFYDSSNRLLASWGNSESYAQESVMVAWVEKANARERPINPLSCEKSCTQFAVTPLLVEGKNAGVVVIGIPLVAVVLGFQDISGAHIGLLMKEQGNKVNGSNMIANWNFQIAAHSRDMNVAILNKAAELYPDFDNLEDGIRVAWANQYFQVKPLPLEKIGTSAKAQLIVVTDITSTIRTI
ncbi:MAG: GGDEF domain-containing protein, partial [Betaproteobacteria bacterium]|nr:GGDEF domain-containing protein [Betaproteobacteria bacterium]